ncbi:hypothetical protein DFQ28_004011 [Apophysomyces sp. BC1034]|nr:hypothetical protein DFQ30_005416 [Apophysomyces sp. BC1015]KAG0178846.1 hypothetical protein DFQ29_002914 [Apophysomyces sp. BC1021]KAG0189016.1 hypothetical protein DFQ28_004011 [Apophysomyces sp. BC1034]
MSLLLYYLTDHFKKTQDANLRILTGVFGTLAVGLLLKNIADPRKRDFLAVNDHGSPAQSLPSPRGALPLIGHVGYLLKSPHLQMAEWAQTLGPMYLISLGQRDYLILNNAEVVREILEIRGQMNSDRVPTTIIQLMSKSGLVFAWGNENAFLKKSRRLLLSAISRKNLGRKYPELYNKETEALICQIYRHGTGPQGMPLHAYAYLYTINVSMRLLYGIHFESPDDPGWKELYALAIDFSRLGMAMLIECPRPLEFLVGHLKQDAKEMQLRFQKIFGRYNNMLRDAAANGREIECLMNDIIKNEEKENLTPIELENIAATIMIAATDTTAITLQNLFIILLNHPDVQQKAQAELDAVIGLDKLPTEQDLIRLPYIQAIITETMRFRPPIFLNLPRSTRERQIYKGYEIPANVGILHNIYATNFDPTIYHQPHVFNPDRFYNTSGCDQRDHWSFGAGRRLCPGNVFAEKSLALSTARVLWAFTIVPPKVDGKVLQVPITDIALPVQEPAHVDIAFVPRRENLGEILFSS